MPPDADKQRRARAASTSQLDDIVVGDLTPLPLSLSRESSLNFKLNLNDIEERDAIRRKNQLLTTVGSTSSSDSSLIVGPFVEDDFIYDTNDINNDVSIECVYNKRVKLDFSYMEQPIRCYFTCQDKTLFRTTLSSNAKGGVYATKSMHQNEEFTLHPQIDGSVVIQSTKHNHRFLCSDKNGNVYTSETCLNNMEKWNIVQARDDTTGNEIPGGYYITTYNHSNRALSCANNDSHNASIQAQEMIVDGCSHQIWKIEFGSGELCFISNGSRHQSSSKRSSPSHNPMMMTFPNFNHNPNNTDASNNKQQLRCDFGGKLSMSNNCKGWEAWRFSEIDGSGLVRITPFAHEHKFLCNDNNGYVYTNEERNNSTKWSVEKAPPGYNGVIIRSATNNQILKYDSHHDSLITVLTTATTSGSDTDDVERLVVNRGTQLVAFDESCVWEFEPLHRNIYYLSGMTATDIVNSSNKNNNGRRVGVTNRHSDELTMSRKFPMMNMRKPGEEWKIQSKEDDPTVVTLHNELRQSYLASSSSGAVYLKSSSASSKNGEEEESDNEWIIEERGNGQMVLVSKVHKRILTYDQETKTFQTISEIDDDNEITCYWKLEPKVPRKVNEEKMKALGFAISIGLATTLATPVLMGGAIGIIGITEVGVAGQAIMGSIRAAEAISTLTRLTVSSSNLISTQSSLHNQLGNGSNSNNNNTNNDGGKSKDTGCGSSTRNIDNGGKNGSIKNRPFCSWRSW